MVAAVLALWATTAGPAIPFAAGADWSFPLPAFPEAPPGDGSHWPGGSAPLPPQFVSAENPTRRSTPPSGGSAEGDRAWNAAPTSEAAVHPPPASTDAASPASQPGFATVDWEAEDGPYFVPVTEPGLPGEGARHDEPGERIESDVTGVVERHFPSSRPPADSGDDPDYQAVVEGPPPGLLRRWLKRRAPPQDSPEFWRSWLEEPVSGGMAVGYFQGSALIDDWVDEDAGLIGTGRLGWDFAPNLGLETRLSFGSVELSDSFAAVTARSAADDAAGLSVTDPLRRQFTDRNATAFQWDVSLLYYPTDYHPARFYLLWGAGLTRMDFTDRFGESYEGTYFTMPVGFGIKFRRLTDPVFRLEFTDNIVFPSRFNVTHHLALTAGLEFRWGGPRRRYWPWNPGY
ncbi:MAG: hypothetical protein GYA33_12295 [Thermogutta sp.]|nr:hypothetical protein [Thermogutta sp.]